MRRLVLANRQGGRGVPAGTSRADALDGRAALSRASVGSGRQRVDRQVQDARARRHSAGGDCAPRGAPGQHCTVNGNDGSGKLCLSGNHAVSCFRPVARGARAVLASGCIRLLLVVALGSRFTANLGRRILEEGRVKTTSRSRLAAIAVALVTVLVLCGCTGSPSRRTPTPLATPTTTIALAVRINFVGAGIRTASARDIAKVARATACNSWVLDAYGRTDLIVKVLVSTSDVAKVKADLSRLHAVSGSVAEIARSQFDQTPAVAPGFRVVPGTCT